ncbi:MAG: RnfABCDGE type electron transport complex subunit B [Saprospiraceae bacterium]|nr:RnfABCDGE type electron transport complex subunit B [Saprospiraceae bacterium]
MWGEVIISIVLLTGLGLLFATILAIAYKKMKVYEDPRIDQVESMLPGANCGACGMPGCRAFAEKLVAMELSPGKCTVSSPTGVEKIAAFLGVDAGGGEKIVARLLCAGGAKESPRRVAYSGHLNTCRGEATIAGGTKDCNWGCLGLGDCAEACDFDAIHLNANGLPVVDIDQCVACNDCVEVCPKNLFTLMPVSQKLMVQCKSLLAGDEALARCSVACNACGRCAADSIPGVIEMANNLAVIHYDMNELTSPLSTARCPTGAIVWLENDRQFEQKTTSPLAVGTVDTSEFEEDIYYQ